MFLAALKSAGFALLLATAGLPLYFAQTPEVKLPRQDNVWATPDDTPVYDVAWTPAGDAVHGVINPGQGGRNLATYRLGQAGTDCKLDGYGSATTVDVSAEGAVLVGTDRGHVYRFKNGRFQPILKTAGPDPAIVRLVALSGGRVAVATGSSIRLIDAWGKQLWSQDLVWLGLNSLAASADGQTLVAGSHRHRVAVIDVCSGRISNVIETRQISPVAAISPDGRHVYGGGMDGSLTAWDARTGEIEWIRTCGDQNVSELDVSPDGRRIAAGGWNDAVTVWSETGDLLETLPVSRTAAVRFSPDGSSLALSAYGGGVQVVPLGVRF